VQPDHGLMWSYRTSSRIELFEQLSFATGSKMLFSTISSSVLTQAACNYLPRSCATRCTPGRLPTSLISTLRIVRCSVRYLESIDQIFECAMPNCFFATMLFAIFCPDTLGP